MEGPSKPSGVPTDQRHADVVAYLQRKEEHKEQLATRLASLEAQLLRVSDETQRGRLYEQIRAREEQLRLTASDLEREKIRCAEILKDLQDKAAG